CAKPGCRSEWPLPAASFVPGGWENVRVADGTLCCHPPGLGRSAQSLPWQVDPRLEPLPWLPQSRTRDPDRLEIEAPLTTSSTTTTTVRAFRQKPSPRHCDQQAPRQPPLTGGLHLGRVLRPRRL